MIVSPPFGFRTGTPLDHDSHTVAGEAKRCRWSGERNSDGYAVKQE